MFKRRAARPVFAKIASLFWPKMGWRRAFSYYWHRLKRIPGTPESIAMGFACGAGASMLPLMGFHFLLSAFFAWVFRGSIIASAIGTAVGNPWTFPFIWLGTFELGKLVLQIDTEVVGERPFRTMFEGLYSSVRNFDGGMFVDQVLPTFLPMLLGSLPVAIVAGVVSYFVVLKPIRTVHKIRHDRKEARKANYVSAESSR